MLAAPCTARGPASPYLWDAAMAQAARTGCTHPWPPAPPACPSQLGPGWALPLWVALTARPRRQQQLPCRDLPTRHTTGGLLMRGPKPRCSHVMPPPPTGLHPTPPPPVHHLPLHSDLTIHPSCHPHIHSTIGRAAIRARASARPAPWLPLCPTASQRGTTAPPWATHKLQHTTCHLQETWECRETG